MKIDTVINNAGMLSRDNLNNVSESRLQKMFMVNSIGPLVLSKYVLPNMIKANKGNILFFCPPYAIDKKTTLLLPYMQSKLAQTTYMSSLANAMKKTSIGIAGFWTKYPIYTDALTHRQIGSKDKCMDPAIIASMVKLMLEENPKDINGKVCIDHEYLLSKNIDLMQFALGKNVQSLDEMFLEHLQQNNNKINN